MLLIASANSIDISFLRVSQAGDLPVWTQEFPNDLFPADLPLTKNKDESFPLGFELDIGCTNRLLQEDGSPYPVAPMVHILTTSGVLCSFYVLNTTASYVDICSPPRPIEASALSLFKAASQEPEIFRTPPKAEMPFTPPIGQSTPAIPKVQPMATKTQPVSSIFGLSSITSSASQPFTQSAFQSIVKTTAPSVVPITTPAQPPTALITLPQTYTPSEPQAKTAAIQPKLVEKPNAAEDEQIYARMIQDEIRAFELELRTVMDKSRSLKVNIGTKEESAEMRRSIEALDELKKEATETIDSLRSEVQSSRLGMTEMFSMVFEARAKFEQTKSEKSIFMNQNQVQDRSSKRTLDRLVKQLSACEMQLQTAIQVMNAQWSEYQDAISKSKRHRMHNPSLEGLYQTLTKQHEIIYRQCDKVAMLKCKLGLRDNVMKQKSANPSMDSFSDSMIALTIADQVQIENAKLNNKKLKNLRNLLADRDVVVIKPQRPEGAGISSEIILEMKRQMKKRQLEEVPKKPTPVVATKAPVAPLTQPVAPSPFPSFNQAPASTTAQATPQSVFSLQQKPLSFGLTTSTTPAAGPLSFGKKPEEAVKPTPFSDFGTPSFGLNLSTGKPPSFGLSSSSLVLEAEKKKGESQAPRLYLNPVAHTTKTPTTISNADVAVSATFSIPLANKVGPAKEQSRVVEKKQDENKPPTTSENTSFTFKLAEKKDESPTVTIRAPQTTPNFAALLPSSTEGSKEFSFAPKTDTKPNSNSTAFSGFGSAAPTTSSGSMFGTSFSGFGSGFSLNLGSEASKPSTGFSLNLASTNDLTKSTTTAASFSFASLSSSIPPAPTDLSTVKVQPTATASVSAAYAPPAT